jgi:hypothetical protein
LKIKLKGLQFDTIEVIEAEAQVVLNTLTEQDLQDAFKNGRSTEDFAYVQKGTASRVMVASRPKVNFFFTRWQHQSWKSWMVLCMLN